jgi:hypothetical protein
MARISAAAIALLGWYALLLQLYLVIVTARATGASVTTAVVNYFSFFTILTNLFVASLLTLSLKNKSSKMSTFVRRHTAQSAAALYIAIVGIVYSLVLRNLWAPGGLQRIADVILHDAIPILYVLYWLTFVRKSVSSLPFRHILGWLWYPALYLVYSLVRGAITGIYLYPFIDVSQLGYARVAQNALVLMLAFLGASLFLVFIARWTATRVSPNS